MLAETDFFSCPSLAAKDDVLSHFSSLISNAEKDVTYSCGSCGYELNLNSCNRNTTVIGSEYGKTMRRGVLSFLCIDESRFTQISKLRCSPYFRSKKSWGLFRRHTKLLCRKCGSYVGIACIEKKNSSNTSASLPRNMAKSDATTNWDGLSTSRTYDIKICALRPSVESIDLSPVS